MGAVSVSGRSPVREAEGAEGWAGREIASGGKGRGKEKTVPVRKPEGNERTCGQTGLLLLFISEVNGSVFDFG